MDVAGSDWGTLAGGFLAHRYRGEQQWSGFFFMALSLIGLLTSLAISRVPAADDARRYEWNWAKQFFEEIRQMRQDAVLWVAVIANTFFWFLGAILLLNIVLYATDILQVDETRSSYLLAALSLGIGAGSFLAGHVSGRKIETGMILPGMTGIVLATGVLFVPGRLRDGDAAAGCVGDFCRILRGAHQRADSEPSESGGERASHWSIQSAFLRWHRAATSGAVCHAAARASGSRSRVSDLFADVHRYGLCAGADAARIMA